MTNALRFLLRAACIITVAFAMAYLLSHVARRSEWFKERLFQQLLAGNEADRLRAVSILADVGGEYQLLRGLKVTDQDISDMARRGLDHLWFSAAGRHAYELMEKAYALAEEKKHEESIQVLDRILERYPNYAEALNRRAASHWQLGNFKQSREDCERALSINPNHYGAWQGLGISQLQMGDVDEACRSLRTALRIAPNDQITRRCLRKCEELLRQLPGQKAPARDPDLL